MTGVPSMIGGTSTGVSLQAVIDAARRLDELSTARVIGEAAEAVHKAQQGGQPLGTLTPQAIVVSAASISLTPPSTAAVAYSAPEKLRGLPGDRRSDVFSLGILLWEALAHTRLFQGASDDASKTAVLEQPIVPPSEHNANVPAELDAICKKALARDPADRYQSAKVMAAEISAVLDDAGYPDSNEQIASYLKTAFAAVPAPPAMSAVAAPAPAGAALAAKLAATPSKAATPAKSALNMTTLGMAPLRDVAAVEPAKPEPIAATPIAATPIDARPDPAKTMTAGSSMSADDVKAEIAKLASDAKPAASAVKSAADAKPTADVISPTAFVAATPSVAAPANPATTAKMGSLGSQAAAPPVAAPAPAVAPEPAKYEPQITMPGAAPAKHPVIPASISQAETVTTPIVGAATIQDAILPQRPSAPILPARAATGSDAVDPSAAVSLPRPRAQTGSGADKGTGPRDVLAGWAWTDSHAQIADGSGYEDEEPDTSSRKRLLIAIGGALAVILVIVVIAVAASGGEKAKPKDETSAIAPDTSRTAAEPVAKATDVPPAPAQADPTAANAAATEPAPTPTEPAIPATATEPAPTPTEPATEPAKPAVATAEPVKPAVAVAEPVKPAVAVTEAVKPSPVKPTPAKAEPVKPSPALAKAEPSKPPVALKPERVKPTPSTKKEPKLKTTAARPIDPYATASPEKPKFDAAAAYKAGFQQYVRGDTAGALSTFKSSLASSSSYAPTWRGMGLAYEKLGQKAQAKSAFRRYLQLSPTASDAASIRARMEKL